MTQCSFLLACVALFADSVCAEGLDWGTIRGQVTCDFFEPVGPLVGFDPNKDPLCPKQMLDESLVIEQESRGLKNVLVFTRPTPTRIHSRYDEGLKREVVLSAKDCQFTPRICVVWRHRQTFVMRNEDGSGHNFVGYFDRTSTALNELLPVNTGRFEYVGFQRASPRPNELVCNIHPWMKAYVLAIDSPYFALSDEHGKFEIADLPADEDLSFYFWHERYEFFTPAGKRERTPLTLKLTAGEARELEPIVLARPYEDSGR
jgi:hypothetical protein